jgi:hypothetical protein
VLKSGELTPPIPTTRSDHPIYEPRQKDSRKMRKSIIPMSLAILAPLLWGGCLGLHFGGGTKTTMESKSQTYNVTLGQQLIDLQKAYDAGIITQSEYDSEKSKLLRHYLAR